MKIRPLRWFARLSLAVAALAIVAWAVGRAMTDRTLPTQYIFWIPALAMVLPAVLLSGIGLAVLARRDGARDEQAQGAGRRRRSAVPRAIFVTSLLAVAWVLLVDWHVLRYVRPVQSDGDGELTLLHWNMNGQHPVLWGDLVERLPRDADALLLTNVHRGVRFRELGEHLGAEFQVRQSFHLAVASRLPILAQGGFSLNLPRPEAFPESSVTRSSPPIEPRPAPPRLPSQQGWYDPGSVMWARLDATEDLGRGIVVWIIDLPSDVRLSRRGVSEFVVNRLAELRQTGTLPEPDIIAGDFNIPRGSFALGLIARGMRHAYDDAGRGPSPTYPSSRPMVHIDHVFLRPPLHATSYRITDPGGSSHLAQRVTVGER